MVFVIHNCKCDTCPGNVSAGKDENGQPMYGGSICNCACHTKKKVLTLQMILDAIKNLPKRSKP